MVLNLSLKQKGFAPTFSFSGQLQQGKGTSGLFYTLGVTQSPKQLPGYRLTSLFCSKITTINSSKKGFKSFNPPYIFGAHHFKCTLSSNHCPHLIPQYFPTFSPPLSYDLHLSLCIHNTPLCPAAGMPNTTPAYIPNKFPPLPSHCSTYPPSFLSIF